MVLNLDLVAKYIYLRQVNVSQSKLVNRAFILDLVLVILVAVEVEKRKYDDDNDQRMMMMMMSLTRLLLVNFMMIIMLT